MPVNDVGRSLSDPRRDRAQGVKVGVIELPAYGEPAYAECELGRKFGKGRVRPRTAGQSVGDEPDAMPEIGLTTGNIEHMPEKPADRRPQDVQDFQRGGQRRKAIPDDRRGGPGGLASGRRFYLDGGPSVGHRSVP